MSLCIFSDVPENGRSHNELGLWTISSLQGQWKHKYTVWYQEHVELTKTRTTRPLHVNIIIVIKQNVYSKDNGECITSLNVKKKKPCCFSSCHKKIITTITTIKPWVSTIWDWFHRLLLPSIFFAIKKKGIPHKV